MQDLQHSYPVAKVAKNVNGTTFGEGVSLKVHNGIKSILKTQNIIFNTTEEEKWINNLAKIQWYKSKMAVLEMISTHCELLQDRGLTYVVSDKILTNKTSLRCLAEGVKFCAKNSSLFFWLIRRKMVFTARLLTL